MIRGKAANVLAMAATLLFASAIPPFANAAVNQWTTLRPGPHRSVAVARPGFQGAPGVIYAGFAGDNASGPAVVLSDDGGETWTVTPLQAAANALSASNRTPGLAFAATDNGLFRTTDFGRSWTMANPAVRYWVSFNTGSDNIVYGDNLRSIDGGLTWTAMSGLAAPSSSFWGAGDFHIQGSAGDPDFLLAFSPTSNGQGIAMVSRDAGATWSPLTGLARSDVFSVAVDPVDARNHYIGYCNYIQRFSATGSSTSFTDGDIYTLMVDPISPNRVYCLTQDGLMWRSSDFTRTWQTFAPGPYSFRSRMVIDRDQKVYLPGTSLWVMQTESCSDSDGDGFFGQAGCGTAVDCNDNNALVRPGATETCNDGADNDCNGKADCADGSCTGTAYCPVCVDKDGDGFFAVGGCGTTADCNDYDNTVRPGASETLLDGIDQDCNGHDLTIQVTKASYVTSTSTLVVEATSVLGSAAALQVAGYGPMTWVPPTKRAEGKWAITVPGTPNPGTVTVTGPEGSVLATAKTARK